jgi:hypothetical protein
MANIDGYFDELAQWLWLSSVRYSLITWNWASSTVETGVNIAQTSLRGAMSANVNDIWLFRERNTTPWPMKEGWNDTVDTNFGITMSWYPKAQEFIILSDSERIKRNAFTNVVMAELVCTDKNLRYDMSSFFHDIRWHSAESDAPSLYEVVTVYCLTNKLPFSPQLLSSFNLEVMTTDADNLIVPVMSMKPFNSWADYLPKPSTSNDKDAEDAEDDTEDAPVA